ncbi:hypothetical protein SZN_29627 [Streptomyces zinciresistens K42]|uniref:Uncharacterized protein n=1 Tax=Streptomyces zinciresistens K42 TaxID=700597 RepID=G2GK82_9ACTN|nr:hypothetical protein SZN_29627 [Streptomyces zinciresistens K42]
MVGPACTEVEAEHSVARWQVEAADWAAVTGVGRRMRIAMGIALTTS